MALPAAPYSGPWLSPDPKTGKIRYRGPAAVALKRTISRGWDDRHGDPLIPWRPFNDQFNSVLDVAVRKIEALNGLHVDGDVGRSLFSIMRRRKVPVGRPHAGEYAMDPVAVRLFEDAYDIKFPPAPPPLEHVRESMAAYLKEMERYDERWFYTQRRPYTDLGDDPENGGGSDCSAYCMLAYFWARSETGIHVPDPSRLGYSGYGNSQSIWLANDHRKVSAAYEIGDIAIYGPSSRTKHVTICHTPGSAATAIFSSNGSQAGPNPTRVHYRSDLLAVVRPPLLPS